jgi:hypothetical protein
LNHLITSIDQVAVGDKLRFVADHGTTAPAYHNKSFRVLGLGSRTLDMEMLEVVNAAVGKGHVLRSVSFSPCRFEREHMTESEKLFEGGRYVKSS